MLSRPPRGWGAAGGAGASGDSPRTPHREPDPARPEAVAAFVAVALLLCRSRQRQPRAGASVEGIPVLSAETADSFSRGAYVLIFVTHAGVADRSTMHAIAAHCAELLAHSGEEYRQWTAALLDYSTGRRAPPSQPSSRLCCRAPAPRLCVCCARAGLAVFDAKPSVRAVEEWLELRMGGSRGVRSMPPGEPRQPTPTAGQGIDDRDAAGVRATPLHRAAYHPVRSWMCTRVRCGGSAVDRMCSYSQRCIACTLCVTCYS